MIGGRLTIGDELRSDAKKTINKSEISPERLKDYVKILKTNGFLSKLKGNKLVLSQAEVNECVQNNLSLIERLNKAEIALEPGRINFKLNVRLFKTSNPVDVTTAAELKKYTFDVNQRIMEFEIVEPQDVISNEVVAYLLAFMIVQGLQSLLNIRLEMARVLENKEFIEVLCNRVTFDLNKSPYLNTVFSSRVEGISVFDFVRITRIETEKEELAIYPDLSLIS